MSADELDDVFAAGRRASAPEALMVRVEADARAMQPVRAARSGAGQGGGPSWLGLLLAAIGGWRGASGLSAAMIAGFWIGFADPGGALAALQGEPVDLLPGSGEFLAGLEEG